MDGAIGQSQSEVQGTSKADHEKKPNREGRKTGTEGIEPLPARMGELLWNGKRWRMVSDNGCMDTKAITIGTVTELEESKEATSRNAKKGMGQHGTSRTTNDGMAKLPLYVCTVCHAKPMV